MSYEEWLRRNPTYMMPQQPAQYAPQQQEVEYTTKEITIQVPKVIYEEVEISYQVPITNFTELYALCLLLLLHQIRTSERTILAVRGLEDYSSFRGTAST